MDQVTPPPSSYAKHRRTRSTPNRASPGSSLDVTPLISPSTPFSSLEGRGGASIPSTPLSPPPDVFGDLDELFYASSTTEMKGSLKLGTVDARYNSHAFFGTPGDQPAHLDPAATSDGETLCKKSGVDPNPTDRRGRAVQGPPQLTPSRSDPAGIQATTSRQLSQLSDGPFVYVNNDEPVVDLSSGPESSGHGEEGAAFEAYVSAFRGEKIDAGNAQAKLSPEACLFVASLRKDRTDKQLRVALIQEFCKYGTCYVKVKRCGDMPVAFVQYHDKRSAASAMECAVGTLILERPCRIEKAKAPRSVFVSRRDGRMPSRVEVLQLLQQVGQVDRILAVSDLERERFGFALGFSCRFAYYQDSVDAIAYYRDHQVYDVEPFRAPERNQTPTFALDSLLSAPNYLSNVPRFDPNMHIPSALWVGGLPSSVTKSELLRVFSSPRRVISQVDIRIRTTHAGLDEASYAIVQFADDQSALDAALCTHHRLRLHNGIRVRIQWAFKSFIHKPELGGPAARPGNHNPYAVVPHICRGPVFSGNCGFPVDHGRGVPFVNGLGRSALGNPSGRYTIQHVLTNGQVYGMHPGSIATGQIDSGLVTNRGPFWTTVPGYPVANGTRSLHPRLPSKI